MKTAVSLPNDLFHKAELTAKSLHISRSKLYARAIEDFLKRSQPDSVTERLNALYSIESNQLDPEFQHAELELLKKSPW